MANFVPSKYQEAIFNWFRSGTDNSIVGAVAGSGKTTTIVEGMRQLSFDVAKDSFFAAFNKSIVDELKKRINGAVETKTIHALGLQALRDRFKGVKDWDIEDAKYRQMTYGMPFANGDPLRDTVLELVRYAQLSLTDPTPENLCNMAIRFNVDLPSEDSIELVAGMVQTLLDKGLEQTQKGRISFADMLYAPVKLDLPVRQYSLVAVDECQDLSKVQMALVSRAVRKDGRLIGVGDSRQAIYFFAGAEPDSFFQLRDYFSAKTLPLSICYRCPRSVVELARTIVPQIEASETAAYGLVKEINDYEFKRMLQPGDMVLCRMTAPLIKLCFELLTQRVRAIVRGRAIGAQLTSTVKTIAKHPDFSWDRFPAALYQWRDDQIAALQQKPGTEAQIENVRDRAASLMTCYTTFRSSDVAAFCDDIEDLFSDAQEGVVLSTIHRAKGLENPRVFIIRPDKLPLTWKGQTAEEAQQEMNLKYVAITRARNELYFVEPSDNR